jgi:glycerol uptake operon antiterminator
MQTAARQSCQVRFSPNWAVARIRFQEPKSLQSASARNCFSKRVFLPGRYVGLPNAHQKPAPDRHWHRSLFFGSFCAFRCSKRIPPLPVLLFRHFRDCKFLHLAYIYRIAGTLLFLPIFPLCHIYAESSPVDVVFLLSGELCDLEEHCRLLHQAGKKIFLHIDLLDGLKGDSSGIRFLAKYCQPEGIISTKVQCLKIARDAGMQTILRCFAIDTLALKTGAQNVRLAKPDFVEVLPGLSTKIIRLATVHFGIPVIAGGLLNEPEDIAAVLAAGAAAVSTSVPTLWTSDIHPA